MRKNLDERIKEKIDEMGGPAVARRKMGIAIPSGKATDSKLMKNLSDLPFHSCERESFDAYKIVKHCSICGEWIEFPVREIKSRKKKEDMKNGKNNVS